LHLLEVHPAYRRQGTGGALVADFEALVKARGGARHFWARMTKISALRLPRGRGADLSD
jgi:GNAT superfamily N-acetyltransferase